MSITFKPTIYQDEKRRIIFRLQNGRPVADRRYKDDTEPKGYGRLVETDHDAVDTYLKYVGSLEPAK
jgi:hypothetical protein